MKLIKHTLSLLIVVITVTHLAAGQPIAPDTFWTIPKKTFAERQKQYLQLCAMNNDDGSRDGIFSQVARLYLGLQVNEAAVKANIGVVYENHDCNDFALGGLLRLYYLNRTKNVLSPRLVSELEQCFLHFKYWWDEPIKDSAYRCYHTENHQGLYHQNELLAGQLLKSSTFKNGMTGAQHMAHAKLWLDKWLQYRRRFGFSEWLSNHYLDVDMLTLANLYDFAEDTSVKQQAGSIMDMLMYELAVNNFHGILGSTHGRTYNRFVTDAREESVSPVMKLMFGVGIFNSPKMMGAISLATGAYRCPLVIQKIAVDYETPLLNYERQSIDVNEAAKYGLSLTNDDDIGLYWGMQEFVHPLVINISEKNSEKYDVWPYHNYEQFNEAYALQIKENGKIINPYLDRYGLSAANIITYRTPDYMLSSVQDYRPGNKGYQQHIWQATLGLDAVVFCNHPGEAEPHPSEKESSPAYWAGNKTLPRVAQEKNVVICLYNISSGDELPFSHAYFPFDGFDEVVERGNWMFARKKNGYIALYSSHKPHWIEENHRKNELRANSPENVWICETGSAKQWKNFSAFVKAVSSAELNCKGLKVDYFSPSVGKLNFDWTGPLSVKSQKINLHNFARADNRYTHTLWGTKSINLVTSYGKYKIDL